MIIINRLEEVCINMNIKSSIVYIKTLRESFNKNENIYDFVVNSFVKHKQVPLFYRIINLNRGKCF